MQVAVRLKEIQDRINTLLARFVAEVRGAGAISRTDINHVAEVVLVPLLAEAFGYRHLRSLNIAEGENFPGVDLGDDVARFAIQVTSTPTMEKIRHTLETFGRHDLGKRYDRLVVYILTEKQKRYSADAISASIPARLAFDPRSDVWDWTDLLRQIAQLDIDGAERILQLLEAHFGDGRVFPFEKDVAEPLRQYLDGLISLATRLPAYYPKSVTFEGIRQRVRVSADRLRWSDDLARLGEAARRRGEFRDDDTGRAYLWRSSERFGASDIAAKSEVKPWEDAWSGGGATVVLGDPGFGKTWLLRAEACRLARAARAIVDDDRGLGEIVLPIYARLSDVNRTDGPLARELLDHACGDGVSALRVWAERKLASGQCVVLLDAWDEVPAERLEDGELPRFKKGYRQLLGRRLEAFSRDYPAARVVMTSRIVGYGSSPLPGAKEMELVAFDEPEIEAFAGAWFGAGSDEERRFLDAVRASHQVGQLARIPLLLSMMCRAFAETGRRFPARRTDLYDRCLTGLLRDWKEEKAAEVDDSELDALVELLEPVALDLLEAGAEQFSTRKLREVVEAWVKTAPPGHELHGRKASSLIARLKRDGVFVQAGEQRDAPLLFLHRTFQEYLAAGALARRGWEAIADLVDERTMDAEWDEVLVLLAGRLARPGDLVERLADPNRDSAIRHRLGLAAECLAEVADIEGLPKGLVDRIIEDAIAVWRGHDDAGTLDTLGFGPRALRALIGAEGTIEGERLREWLRKQLSDDSAADVFTALGLIRQIGSAAATPATIGRLLVLTKASDPATRFNAARALGALAGEAKPLVTDRLLDLWLDEDPVVVSVAAEELAALGRLAGTPEVIDRVLAYLLQNDPNVYRFAAWALPSIVQAAPHETIDHVLTRSHEEDSQLRFEIAQALIALGSAATPRVIDRLLALSLDEDMAVRCAAIRALGALGSAATLDVIDRLLALSLDEDSNVAFQAMTALGGLGNPGTPEIIDRLFTLARDKSSLVRLDAAWALGALGRATPGEIVDRLLTFLDDEDALAREWAVAALGALGRAAATPEVIDRLIDLSRDQHSALSTQTARALGNINGVGSPERVHRLLTLSGDAGVCDWATRTLRALGGAAATPEVIDRLSRLLRDEDVGVTEWAATTLGGLGNAVAPEVIERLLPLSYEESRVTRYRVGETLRMLGSAAATPEVIDRLFALLRDEDSSVRRAAAMTLRRMGSAVRRVKG